VVDTLTERWQVEESRQEDRREQRDNDELSQQQQRFQNREGKS
jgi:flagellar biosynthesis chaperone FliJ